MSRFTDRVDMSFSYVHSSKTNLHKTFARIRREMEAKRKAAEEAAKAEQVGKVRQLKGAAK